MSSFQPRKVYIASSFMGPVGRYTGKEREKLSFLEMAAKASELFSTGKVRRSDVNAVVVGCQNPVAFSGVDNTAAKIAGVLGISGAKSVLIDTASSSGASALEYAYLQIASGRCDHVLALGIQKMSDVSTAAATRIVAGVIDREEGEFGLTMPACGALVAGALMNRLKLDIDEWTAFSALLTQRAHRFAAQNPDAHLNFEIPLEQYYREIVNGKNYRYWYPLRYHDFCPMSDGVAGVLLSALPHEVMVSGVGSATDIPTIADRPYFHSFPATVRAASEAYAMAEIKNITDFAGRIHVNMHDPFNGFGPINMVDLGFVPRRRIVEALLNDELTGPDGAFPTNLTGGLKGRGHPLGATGMIQIVENHKLIQEGRFDLGLAHSIGGPINNNVVTLIERTGHYRARPHAAVSPWGLPPLGQMKPKEANVASLLASGTETEGRYVAATTRFDYKTGLPEGVIVIVSCAFSGKRYPFLFGLGPESYELVQGLAPGDRITLERSGEDILVNRMPVRRFYQRTVDGVLELAGNGWKRLTGAV
ncbi:thiolase family protein [Geomesophilobacter sediminis]|uniref:Thiolase family protein n=1 Tax=Geomesophilobacter sediminis TaxID=2798584 RepID=A0A8J7M4G2_9BACT|nr:thiolase family protein [Geomesophilobacter sediminis]MBJ6727906.1 thiolase family protein [Geomesophilobacter sediminis]